MARNMKPNSGGRAARGRNAATPREIAEEVKEFGGELPKAADIKALAKDLATMNADMASIRGKIGSTIKNAETDQNVHRGALREVLKMHKMDPQKREDYQRHVAHYALVLGIGYQPDLFKDQPAAKPARAEPANADNVTPFTPPPPGLQ